MILTFLALAAAAAVQTPAYDISGLQIFWNVASILESDREPTEAEWARLLEHPGYAQIERQGQRGEAVRACLPLVFQPSRRAELAGALEEADGRTKRVCDHLARVRGRREELRAFEAELPGGSELARAVELAARYLPDGVVEGPPPPVYVILFEQNGFGGSALALDATLLLDNTDAGRLGYLAHEFHHVFRRSPFG